MKDHTHVLNQDVTYGDEYTLLKGTKVSQVETNSYYYWCATSDNKIYAFFKYMLTPRYIIESEEDLDRIINE